MASLEVLNTTDDSELFPYDDYSLLSEISVSSTQVKQANQPNNSSTFNFTNMQSALTTGSSDSSLEIHSQINELIEENNLLKEKLNKTNQTMEENFEKAKEKISSLENENSELRVEVASLKMNGNRVKSPCEKCTTLDTGLTNMLGVDYMEDNQELILAWSYFRENLYGNLQYICKQLEDVSKTKKSYEEKSLLDCYILMLKFKMAFSDGSGDVLKFASLRTDEETGFEVVRLKVEGSPQQLNLVIEDLTKALKRRDEALEKRDEQLTTLKRERENFLERIRACESKIHECESALKSEKEKTVPPQYKEICKTLEQENKRLQNSKESSSSMSNDHSVEKLKESIQNLKEILKLEQQTNKKDKEKLVDVMTKCEKLQVDFDRVTKLLEIQSKDEKEKKMEFELKEKSYQDKIDHLTSQLVNIKAILDRKAADFRQLEAKFFMEDPRKPDVSRDQGSSVQKNENGDILCPICGMRLLDEHSAQKHVNRCLDKK